MSERPKIVCLCASSRFVDLVAVKAWELEKQGVIALSMHLLPAWYTSVPHHLAESQGVAEVLDNLHLRKIEIADEVFVVNEDGYIGERTRIEIDYAHNLGKPVHYLHEGMAGR